MEKISKIIPRTEFYKAYIKEKKRRQKLKRQEKREKLLKMIELIRNS